MSAVYMRVWGVIVLALVNLKSWIDHEDLGTMELLNCTFWTAASCAFLVYTHYRYPLVRNGIWGFKHPNDLLVIYTCLLALWPHAALLFITSSTKKFAAALLVGPSVCPTHGQAKTSTSLVVCFEYLVSTVRTVL